MIALETDNSTQNQSIPKHWDVAPPIPDYVNQELREFSPFMRQLLFNRGLTSAQAARAFIEGKSPYDTNPLLIKDMQKAVDILHSALENQAKIAIYGDYDADGVTSSALTFEFLSALGAQPRVYIPNRFDEGYGLNLDAIDQLASEGIQLVITVDCGVRSVKEVQRANELGMQTIITDHHLPSDPLPPAQAVINPRQDGDIYPEKHLAGVGLAYKLAQAYLQTYTQPDLSADRWLDLVAIGTIADLAPLIGENRELVKAGLNQIRRTERQGVFSLAQVAGINLDKINAGNIGFNIGPRLNAAGRIDSALSAFDLLVTKDIFTAGILAQKLEAQNTQRQNIMNEIQDAAIAMSYADEPDQPIIFAASPEFNEGVIGLAASRVTEAFYRPAIIGHQDETHTVASCRSINEFNITEALDQCAELLVRYGGHSAAAGLTVRNENLTELIARLRALAAETFKGLALTPELFIDREIQLDKLEGKHIPMILDDLHYLEPTGRNNPEAIFCSRKCQTRNVRTVGADGKHLKLRILSGNRDFDAIAFRHGHWLDKLPKYIDIAYTFELNEYMGQSSLQLNIKDIKPTQEG